MCIRDRFVGLRLQYTYVGLSGHAFGDWDHFLFDTIYCLDWNYSLLISLDRLLYTLNSSITCMCLQFIMILILAAHAPTMINVPSPRVT